ncbi:hypothetical protein FRB98_008300, partial [Tulasnella sp. 332]
MAPPSASDYLAKAISQNKIITFRLLSRELSIHVNEAKNQLAAYHAATRSSSQPTYATFLLSGDVTIVPNPTEPTLNTDSQDSAPPSTQPEASQTDIKVEVPARLERRITLAGESDVEIVKGQYSRLSCVHIYSISAAPIKDSVALAAPMERVRVIDGERGVDHAKKVGMTVVPNAKWSKPLAKAPTATKVKDEKSATSSKPPVTAPPPAEKKKTSLLDWSKSKPKDKTAIAPPQKPKVKEENDGDTKNPAELDSKSPAPPASKAKVEETSPSSSKTIKPKEEGTSTSNTKTMLQVPESSGKKRVTTARPLSKQNYDANKPSSSKNTTAKPASKQTTKTAENPMMHRPTAATRSSGMDPDTSNASDSGESSITTRLKKGRVVSDEEEEEEEEAPIKKPSGLKRKSVALSSEDEDTEPEKMKRSRLVKGKSSVQKDLEKMMDSDEEEEGEGEESHDQKALASRSASPAASEEDSAPEHVPHTKAIRGMPKKDRPTGIDVSNKPRKRKEKVPIGSNGKPKKKVTRTEKTKNAKGFMVMKDVSDWETDSQAETEEESATESKVVKKAKPTPTGPTKPKPKSKVRVKQEEETEEEGDEEAAKGGKTSSRSKAPRPSMGKRKASTPGSSREDEEDDNPKQAKQPKIEAASFKPRESTSNATSDQARGAGKSKPSVKPSGGGPRKSSQAGLGSYFQKNIASGIGLLIVLLLLVNHHNDPQTGLSRFGFTLGGNREWPVSVGDKLQEAEADYAISVDKRHAFMRETGINPKAIEAWPGQNHEHHMYTLWDFFLPAFQCPHKVQRVGTLGDGGKWVCGLKQVAKQRECVVYSVGVNGESSFEAELLQSTNCQVWGYDYSVDRFGPEIDLKPELKARSHFYAYALGGTDDFGPGKNPSFYTLPTLMKMNGHDFIDILKIDIEGAEFSVLTDLLKGYKGRPLPFGQLQLEVHAWGKEFYEFVEWWEALEGAGLRPFFIEPNLVYLNLFRGSIPDLTE